MNGNQVKDHSPLSPQILPPLPSLSCRLKRRRLTPLIQSPQTRVFHFILLSFTIILFIMSFFLRKKAVKGDKKVIMTIQ